MNVLVQDVKRKEVDLTEVWVGQRLMYVVQSETNDGFHVVDPFMVLPMVNQPTKESAVNSAIKALTSLPV